MDGYKELKEALSASIEMEKKGREFYLKAAKGVSNELGKNVFEALADDETRHIAAIREYCELIAKKNRTPALCAVMPRHKKIEERIIFGRRELELLRKISSQADELKAYEVAMEMENKGYDFYKKTLNSTTDANARELYGFLLSEEEAHYRLLSDTYKYIKNPAAYFAKEEKPIVEG